MIRHLPFSLLRRKDLQNAFKAWWSWRQGLAEGLIGAEYFLLGRSLGWKLCFNNVKEGAYLLASPVSSTRYFEFAFARDALPDKWQLALDVSSPFIFSLDIAGRESDATLHIMNPDIREIESLQKFFKVYNPRKSVKLFNSGVEELDQMNNMYDVIWSLSVVEHIESVNGDDRHAVKRMFRALRPGGRLILTMPTDKSGWREYRDNDPYGTQTGESDSTGAIQYFFQRFYDDKALKERIIDSVGVSPAKIAWYGEKVKGRFHDYIARWRALGRAAVLNDPSEFAMHYQRYHSWDSMPGAGVCGLVFVKP